MKNKRIILTLSSAISVLSSFSVLSVKCGSKDEINETSNDGKFKILVSEDPDVNKNKEVNKASENSVDLFLVKSMTKFWRSFRMR
ncbi:hypothetical protein [Mycoplasmopsis agalactiae]|uniref:hypothetical protein n=1 Tax=Mycoplasmopsis agalactiae TaxID=2110 RepID=UPI00030BF992|nr:hypothetical protein [Mycoplasmopsis agalactiae]